jgi:hypothetical protein
MRERDNSLLDDFSEDNNRSRIGKVNVSNYKEEKSKS